MKRPTHFVARPITLHRKYLWAPSTVRRMRNDDDNDVACRCPWLHWLHCSFASTCLTVLGRTFSRICMVECVSICHVHVHDKLKHIRPYKCAKTCALKLSGKLRQTNNAANATRDNDKPRHYHHHCACVLLYSVPISISGAM